MIPGLDYQVSLKAARINAGLTVKESAKLLGISPSTLIKREKDPENLTIRQQEEFSRLYRIPKEMIFFGTQLELKVRLDKNFRVISEFNSIKEARHESVG